MCLYPYGTTRIPLNGSLWNLIFVYFSKIFREYSNFINYVLNRMTGTLHENVCVLMIISRRILVIMRNVRKKKSRRENQNTHFIYSNYFSRKSRRLCNSMWKYSRARQATVDNMVHAYFVLNNKGYRHTLWVCNIYYFSTATMVTRTLCKLLV